MPEILMKIDGVEGEVEIPGYENWIKILGIDMGVSLPAAGERHFGGAAAGGLAHFSPITITKVEDDATPYLVELCGNQKADGNVEVVKLRKAGGEDVAYWKAHIIGADFMNFHQNSEGEGLGTEVYTVSYGEVKLEFAQTDKRTGQPKSPKIIKLDAITKKIKG